MEKKWYKGLIMLISLLFIYTSGFSQIREKEDYDYKTWKTRRSTAGFNGHGGFFFISQPFSSNDLNQIVNGMGLDELPQYMQGMGGLGMGHIGSGWRIGGGGFGAVAKSKGIFEEIVDDETVIYNREFEIEFGGGGLIIERSPWMFTRVNLGIGALIGFGSLNIRIRQNEGSFEWSDLYEQFQGSPSANHGYNIVNEIYLPLFIFQPYFTARLHLIDWMAMEGAVGLTMNAPLNSAWYFDNRELTGDGPEVDFKNPYYRFGFVFGG